MDLLGYNMKMLDEANHYAQLHSTCAKVRVGSAIKPDTPDESLDDLVYGCNHGVMNCKAHGCRRVRLYGDNSKLHRLPSDCDAIHSEVDAISHAARLGVNLNGATIYVTRYPCEACARAIAEAGIKRVVYGRKETLSEYAQLILDFADVEVIKVEEWTEEDDNA